MKLAIWTYPADAPPQCDLRTLRSSASEWTGIIIIEPATSVYPSRDIILITVYIQYYTELLCRECRGIYIIMYNCTLYMLNNLTPLFTITHLFSTVKPRSQAGPNFRPPVKFPTASCTFPPMNLERSPNS